ncbi:MAG: diguanylate cyclase [Gammaproteobacteria bacterium]|nr:diguanylate cyclase [Gammaproteobacteria bacterium]MDH5650342.1 diguanylate cyclase [Gammaproteobacteria bacterium]
MDKNQGYLQMDQFDKAQLLNILQTNPMGMMLISPQGEVVWVNDNFPVISGISSLQVLGKNEDTIPSEYRNLFEDEATIYLAATENRADTWLVVSSQTMADGSHLQYVKDATLVRQLAKERDELKLKITELNQVDNVTGLLNPRGLFQALEPQVSRSRRYENMLSVLIMRLENLPDIQQRVGSDKRDQLLIAIGHILNDQMRWADTIGRLSDNEFMLILPETPEDIAGQLAEKIGARLEELSLPDMNGEQLDLYTRFGMAQWKKGEDVKLLMQRARASLDQGNEIHVKVA